MKILILLLVFIIFYKSKFFIKGFNEDYLSLESSKCYKGFLAIIILFHHISQKVDPNSLFYNFSYVGFLTVAVFFFISGYGTHKSYLKNDNYRKKFLQNKLINILYPYIIVTIIYVIYNKAHCNCYFVDNVFKYIINPNPIVSNSWYIIALLEFNLMYYISMNIFRNKKNLIIFPMIIFNILFIMYFKNGPDIYWYNAVHLFNIGIIFAQYEKQIINFLKKYIYILLPVFYIIFYILFTTYYKEKIFEIQFITSIIIVLLFILINLKIKINNKILLFLGKISYELYMVQGLFLDIFRSRIYNIENDLYFTLLVTISSLVFAYLLHIVLDFTKKIFKKIS